MKYLKVYKISENILHIKTLATAFYISAPRLLSIDDASKAYTKLTDRSHRLWIYSLQWPHNEHDGVSNHQPHDYSGADQRKHQSSASQAMATVTGEFPAQKASNAENVSIWWRRHVPSGNFDIQTTMHQNETKRPLWWLDGRYHRQWRLSFRQFQHIEWHSVNRTTCSVQVSLSPPPLTWTDANSVHWRIYATLGGKFKNIYLISSSSFFTRSLLTEAAERIWGNWAISGSGNGLSRIWCQVIAWSTNDINIVNLKLSIQNFVKFESRYQACLSRKCISTCRLWIGGHFVSSWKCSN